MKPDHLSRSSQQQRILLKLREMILNGELAPGARVAEIPVAGRLGVSRTPVRYALGVLAGEGLIVATDNGRGFLVRGFSLKDIIDAIELRGVLEGMAARLVAESGWTAGLGAELAQCLAEGEGVIAPGRLEAESGERWAGINERFHRLIVHACGSQPLINAVMLNDKLPFASAKAFLGVTRDPAILRRQYEILLMAQRQHQAIVEALSQGKGARAEGLMREHAHAAIDNILLFRGEIPGLAP